ncbi:hypothetical protein NYZ99_17130 [Maribacter litopenaei]|uniref:Uncharacterized protein n=1 Tax=Maribacter litopenaei TaxID=2976127 RepID=A0ABY5Y6B7_9FLAO|nr:hypothetical protein [Maribacter litopenaei]UWX54581.1 hypothetical protein NYZ99_17130 [Maribacter litopenaei]
MVDTNVEEPIYDETQLSLLSIKDTSLQNSVYYFVHSGGADSKKRFDEVTNQLAKDLMVKGARVYVLENADMDGYSSDSLSLAAKREVYGNYSSVINKKYLRHNGSYQRVILLEDNATKGQNTTLSVRHNAKSREGQQFASVLHEVLRKNAKIPGKVQKETNAFKDEASVYLANNLVPPVIILNFSDASDPKSPGFNLKAEKKPLAGLLNDGILQDYSHLNLEN